MFKDQTKGKMIYDPTKSRVGSLKRSNPNSKVLGDEAMGRSECPEASKVVKRKGKEKSNNTVVELVTSHFKKFSITNIEMTKSSKIWSP